jgi:hypothetical protein
LDRFKLKKCINVSKIFDENFVNVLEKKELNAKYCEIENNDTFAIEEKK